MADLHISEFSGLASTPGTTDVLAASADAHITDQALAIGASPGVTSQPFNAATKWLRVKAGAACAVAVADAGDAAPQAAAGGWFLNAGDAEWFRVNAGATLNVVTDTP